MDDRVYAFRARGPFFPANGLCFDPDKLLTGHESVPIMIGAVPPRIEVDHTCWIGAGAVIEQQRFHPTGLPREHAEIDAVRKDGRAQREIPSRVVDALPRLARTVGRRGLRPQPPRRPPRAPADP